MTTTEDRLTDALNAAARTVTAPSLRPLDDHPAPAHAPTDSRSSRRRWLAAVASAAAVALIAGLVVTVSGRLHGSPEGVAAGAPPRYYAENTSGRLYIRATATGRLTAIVPAPRSQGIFGPVTTADDRTFFFDFISAGSLGRVYRFRVTAAGRVSGLAPVPGASFRSDYVAALAASSDGSQLALSLGAYPITPHRPRPEQIVVVNTRTGARATFAGGRTPRGQDPRSVRIVQLSWTANGRELVYLAAWTCRSGLGDFCPDPKVLGAYEQVRTLNPASRGGPLDSGRLLVNAPGGYAGAAAISPDGRTVTIVQVLTEGAISVRAFRVFRIALYSARTGRPLRMVDELRTNPREMVSSFAPSPSGQYLIVINGTRTRTGTINGWLARGRLHRLRPAGVFTGSETW